jgi:hypothetical protein
LTTKKRVQRAIQAVTEGRINLTTEEKKHRLDVIGKHLEYNLLFDRRHCLYSFFWKKRMEKTNQDFNNNLETTIAKINEVMVS